MLPVSSLEKVPTPFHEALFTATSAVCVTGLVVKDSGSYWSVFGQTVILALIQIGGFWSSNRSGSGFASFREKKYLSCKEVQCRMQFQHLKLEESSD